MLELTIALVTLAALEIVLGIDNIVFIAIVTDRLPASTRSKARKLGLLAAMITRIALIFAITWIMRLTAPLFDLMGHAVSGRDLILFAGGLFLIAKSTLEIHHKIDPGNGEEHDDRPAATFTGAVIQIGILDIIFSLDSVITAVGMVSEVWVMVAAVMAAVGVMMLFADPVSEFVGAHPTIQMLALSFLILIGVFLVAESLGKHIDRGYIYFAMAFSLGVEMLNMRARKARRAAGK